MRHLWLATLLSFGIGLQAVPRNSQDTDKSAAHQSAPSKTKRRMIEIKSPNQKYAVRFSEPAWTTPATDGEAPWQKLETWTEGEGWETVEDFRADEPLTVAFAYWEGAKRWSPDGLYFICVEASITGNNRLQHFILRFLDVVGGEWVGFDSPSEDASTENFMGWKPGEPHTMLVRTLKPGVVAEVHPHGE
jgi:hypothetical protein